MGKKPHFEPTVAGKCFDEIERQFLLHQAPAQETLGLPHPLIQVFLNLRFNRRRDPIQLLKGHDDAFYLYAKADSLAWCVKVPDWVKCRLQGQGGRLRMRHEKADGLDAYCATVKSPGRLRRKEWICEAPAWLFQKSMPAGKRLDKIRYMKQEDKLVLIDYFQGPLEGGVIAEMEYDSVEEAIGHAGPQTLGLWSDITWDPRFRQRELIRTGKIPVSIGPAASLPGITKGNE